MKAILPGPGSYNIDNNSLSMIKRFPAYSMGTKPKMTSLLVNMDPDIPVPGKYQEIGMSKNGRYPSSKFINTSGYSFGVRTDTRINIRLSKLHKSISLPHFY